VPPVVSGGGGSAVWAHDCPRPSHYCTCPSRCFCIYYSLHYDYARDRPLPGPGTRTRGAYRAYSRFLHATPHPLRYTTSDLACCQSLSLSLFFPVWIYTYIYIYTYLLDVRIRVRVRSRPRVTVSSRVPKFRSSDGEPAPIPLTPVVFAGSCLSYYESLPRSHRYSFFFCSCALRLCSSLSQLSRIGDDDLWSYGAVLDDRPTDIRNRVPAPASEPQPSVGNRNSSYESRVFRARALLPLCVLLWGHPIHLRRVVFCTRVVVRPQRVLAN
jgi:hypothetical protein